MTTEAPERCDAHAFLGPARYHTDDVDWIADCEKPLHHDTDDPTKVPIHAGPLDHDIELAEGGTSRPQITWAATDRRSYHGDFPGICDEPGVGCILPKGHHGSHAP